MNSINKTIELYKKRVIDKSIFIKDMYATHYSKLFEYAEYLHKTDIEKNHNRKQPCDYYFKKAWHKDIMQ
jgi:hypothetical protein